MRLQQRTVEEFEDVLLSQIQEHFVDRIEVIPTRERSATAHRRTDVVVEIAEFAQFRSVCCKALLSLSSMFLFRRLLTGASRGPVSYFRKLRNTFHTNSVAVAPSVTESPSAASSTLLAFLDAFARLLTRVCGRKNKERIGPFYIVDGLASQELRRTASTTAASEEGSSARMVHGSRLVRERKKKDRSRQKVRWSSISLPLPTSPDQFTHTGGYTQLKGGWRWGGEGVGRRGRGHHG